MLYIDEVIKDECRHGCEVITHVYYTEHLTQKAFKKCTKRDMINYMNNYPSSTVRTKYKKYGYWFEGDDVHVVDNEFLRTDGNNIREDNLGELD